MCRYSDSVICSWIEFLAFLSILSPVHGWCGQAAIMVILQPWVKSRQVLFVFRWPGCSGEPGAKRLHAGRSKLQAAPGTDSNVGLDFDTAPSSSRDREGEQWRDQPRWLIQQKCVFKLPVQGTHYPCGFPASCLGCCQNNTDRHCCFPWPSPNQRRPCCILRKSLSLKQTNKQNITRKEEKKNGWKDVIVNRIKDPAASNRKAVTHFLKGIFKVYNLSLLI